MGGEAAVSKGVESDIKKVLGSGGQVERIAGATRVETAAFAADAIATANMKEHIPTALEPSTVIIATSQNFPDTLSIGPFSYCKNAPIVLVEGNSLPDAAKTAVERPWVKKAIIVGGEAVVSKGIEQQLVKKLGAANVQRLAGTDRYLTSVEITKFEMSNGLTALKPAVATGTNFPDALAGSPLCGKQASVLMLVADGSSPTVAALAGYKSGFAKGYVLGGPAAVPDATAKAIAKAMGTTFK